MLHTCTILPAAICCKPFSTQIKIAGGSDGFGPSVAISDSNVLVGAFGTNNHAGAAYLYNASSGNLLRTFLDPAQKAGDDFGLSVAISGNNILVGAEGTGTNAGAAYLYDASAGSLQHTFADPSQAPSNYFGKSVAVSGSNVLVGVGRDTSDNAAAAYLFSAADIMIDSVKTTDSRRAIVDYTINNPNLTQPFDIQIYRSDRQPYDRDEQRARRTALSCHESNCWNV